MALSALVLTLALLADAQATEGFYKDLFMDSGADLTSRETLHAAEALDLSYDALVTDSSSVQNDTMVTSDDDANGALLYPDGAPRYRVIYTNGGSATQHGTSLGEEGRQRVRDFFAGGGSYTGSCAGAFISMLHYDVDDYEASGPHEPYYHLWPGVGSAGYTGDEYHDIVFEDATHPLVAMYPSLADGLVESVYHNYGCRLDPDHYDNPPETEYLGIVDDPGTTALHGWYNMLAYKPDEESGRVVVICSHPEGSESGEKLDLTAAIIQYALDGLGEPWPEKGALANGEPIEVNGGGELLGDLQYHYWTVDLPAGTERATFTLDGLSEDCDLFASQGERPDRLSYGRSSTAAGFAEEIIELDEPEPGTWYLGVYGAHDVLDGVEYELTATWSAPADTGSWDTGEDAGDGPPDSRPVELGACGCGSGVAPVGWLLLVSAGALARRRPKRR